ncbi:MAG: Crp/Fnr family transcriptional regulator [Syntrophales bacterium]
MVSADLLKEFDFFKGFTDEETKKLADIAVEQSYKAGFQIWKKGDQAKNLYLLEEGKVVMAPDTYMGTAKPPMPVTVDIVAKGEAMGWSAVVGPYLYTLGALCISDSKAIVFDADKLRKLINREIVLGLKFMKAAAKVIANRLNHTQIILIGERGLSVLTEY